MLKVVEKLGNRVYAANQKMVTGARACNVKEVAFSLVHFFEVSIITDGFHVLLQGNYFVITRHAPHMESLVFAPPHVAQHISEIHTAFSTKTWGEFLRKIPQSEFWNLWNSRCKDEEEPLPDPELPFNPAAICEGDYPAWLQQDQDRWLPSEILERWGKRESSVMNGSFWIIDPAQEQEIVQRLSELGINARKRVDLRFH